MPAVKSSPSAENGATDATASAASTAGRRAAHASECGPPPEAPATKHRSAPRCSISEAASSTTNGTFGTQTFGITTGTSNCNPAGLVKLEKEREEFAMKNYPT
ncbi:MAG: DUF3015 family protein, partial [Ilumatobacter sp.]|nr:DUF3015 family protein [Ilumatobacter sp.]